MGRYIDADALIMALRLEYPMMPMFKENQKEWEIKTDGYRKAEEVIKDAPSIDIVRCKECLHSYEWDSGCGAELVCKARRCDPADWGSRVEFYVKADDFCSRGERREP